MQPEATATLEQIDISADNSWEIIILVPQNTFETPEIGGNNNEI